MNNNNELLEQDLNDITNAMDMEELTDEERKILIDDACEQFDAIEGVEFEDLSEEKDKKVIIQKEYDKTNEVLKSNVNRMEKLTKILFTNIALNSNNMDLVSMGIDAIKTQNQNLKLLGELQSKKILNLSAQSKIEASEKPIDGDRKDGNSSDKPPGFDAQ